MVSSASRSPPHLNFVALPHRNRPTRQVPCIQVPPPQLLGRHPCWRSSTSSHAWPRSSHRLGQIWFAIMASLPRLLGSIASSSAQHRPSPPPPAATRGPTPTLLCAAGCCGQNLCSAPSAPTSSSAPIAAVDAGSSPSSTTPSSSVPSSPTSNSQPPHRSSNPLEDHPILNSTLQPDQTTS